MEGVAQTEMKLRDKFIIDAIDFLMVHDKQLTDQERNFRVDMARKVKLHKDITTQEYDSLQETANKVMRQK